MNNIWISPSVMCIPAWEEPRAALRELERCGAALLHADVMDGVFVPNLMLGTDNIKNLRKNTTLPLDLHLMIQNPEDKLGWFGIAPGDWVSVHAESTCRLGRCLDIIRGMGAHPAVAISPATPVSAIQQVLALVDMVLVMTVNPGFAGQKLIPETLDKVAAIRRLLDEMGCAATRVGVDGNVSFENLPAMRAAGGDLFICGTSSVFAKGATVEENFAKINSLVK